VSLGSAAGAPLGMLIGIDAQSRPFEPRAVAEAQALAALLGLHLERLELLRRHAQLEQSLSEQRAANERLERMSQTKSDFVSTVSHEFRTPLTTILGNSEMIQDDGVTIAEVREFAVEINKAGQRLKGMIEDMLDLDRMEAGMLNLRRERLDLNALVGEAVAQIRPITSRHAFRLQLDDAMPPLMADRDKLVQVVTNLVSNAIKYSPDGGEIRVVTAREARHARVSVIDQGMGIPPDALDRVFERFTRVETGQTRSIQGTGLGLPIVRQLVRLHGGRVWAASQLGRGSTFHVTLPFDDGVEAAR
jgi:signal transduction histidine kinase